MLRLSLIMVAGHLKEEEFNYKKLYFLKGKVKVEIAVAKGKKLYDKRQVKKSRIEITRLKKNVNIIL